MLYAKEIPINQTISIMIPTVKEIIDKQEEYYSMISILTAMPIDFMVQLDDIGIDFATLDEFELFLILFPALKSQDTSLIFGDLDISKYTMGVNEQNGNVVLINSDDGSIIDRAIHGKIADTLRSLHYLEKDNRKPANKEARDYLIKRARIKQKRTVPSKKSQLETLIVAMVNTEQFKYDYNTVRDLTIYQFNESVRQITKKVDYTNKMYGVYTGSLDSKNLSEKELNWLIHD